MPNTVYIATSMDGYIAREDGGIDWLLEQPNPSGSDYGFAEFMDGIDGIIMGRNTFETVTEFDEWAYTKPVFVLTNSLTQLSANGQQKVRS
jgi:dihydrofolate reductase